MVYMRGVVQVVPLHRRRFWCRYHKTGTVNDHTDVWFL